MTVLKEKIIQEALRLFSVKGFMSTSTTDIIHRVGTSKGGLYNHFKNKEQLFLEALSYARKIWRERNLAGVDAIDSPIDKLKQILTNYKERYLTNDKDLPGGCIFVNLAVELNDQEPHLAAEINQGFDRLKSMFKRLLEQERQNGGILLSDTELDQVVELIFSSLLGACVMYTSDKSRENLGYTINMLIDYLNRISN
jgi:AcrR family transcriptional regulator